MMSVYSMIFSPTGGTEKVIKIIEKEFPKGKRIDLTCRKESADVRMNREDICLIGMPSYGGRVPHIAVERLRRFKGNQAKAVLVVVYGNREYDDTLLELKNEAEACGFRVAGAIAAVAEHSIMHQFAAGRPDAEDQKEIREFAARIRTKIDIQQGCGEIKVPGNMPYREFKGLSLKPEINKKCTKCGLCAEKCPTGAILKENPSVTNKDRCITCMRCVAICPNHARNLNKVLVFACLLYTSPSPRDLYTSIMQSSA